MIDVAQSSIDTVVLHYDIRFQYSQDHGFKHMGKLVNNSKKVTIVTLCVSPKTLIRRNQSRVLKILRHSFCSFKSLRRLKGAWERHKDYTAGRSLILYKEWFKSLQKNCEIRHWIMDANRSVIAEIFPFEVEKVRIN